MHGQLLHSTLRGCEVLGLAWFGCVFRLVLTCRCFQAYGCVVANSKGGHPKFCFKVRCFCKSWLRVQGLMVERFGGLRVLSAGVRCRAPSIPWLDTCFLCLRVYNTIPRIPTSPMRRSQSPRELNDGLWFGMLRNAQHASQEDKSMVATFQARPCRNHGHTP